MELKEARQAFSLGGIKSFVAIRSVMGKGYELSIIGNQVGQLWNLKTAQGEVRVFASLDTLVGVVESITGAGFYSAHLEMGRGG